MLITILLDSLIVSQLNVLTIYREINSAEKGKQKENKLLGSVPLVLQKVTAGAYSSLMNKKKQK
jgi:hypothetical protein